MGDIGTQRLFTWVDRAFYLIWLGFPVLVWLSAREVLDGPARLAELAPDQAGCIAELPQVVSFSALGQVAYWATFSVETSVYVILLALAHQVIHRCAQGRIFVAPMIRTLRQIGFIIALWPVVNLIQTNIALAIFAAQQDFGSYVPVYALDLPVLGVGLLLIVMAAAMRLAVRLHQDAELTI